MQRHEKAPHDTVPGGRERQRPLSVSPRVRLVALLLLAAHLLLVGWLTLRPVTVMWVPPANVELFATIRAELARGPAAAVRALGGQLLLLAPLGVLLPVLGRQLGGSRFTSFQRTVFAAAMLALLSELSQSAVPSQVPDVDALLLKALGPALVHLLCYGRLRAWLLRAARPSAQPRTVLGHQAASRGRTPRTSRVGIGHGTEALDRSLTVR